jgi:hypothetical protein
VSVKTYLSACRSTCCRSRQRGRSRICSRGPHIGGIPVQYPTADQRRRALGSGRVVGRLPRRPIGACSPGLAPTADDSTCQWRAVAAGVSGAGPLRKTFLPQSKHSHRRPLLEVGFGSGLTSGYMPVLPHRGHFGAIGRSLRATEGHVSGYAVTSSCGLPRPESTGCLSATICAA